MEENCKVEIEVNMIIFHCVYIYELSFMVTASKILTYKINLPRREIYFGSWFHRFKSMITLIDMGLW